MPEWFYLDATVRVYAEDEEDARSKFEDCALYREDESEPDDGSEPSFWGPFVALKP